MRFTASHQQRVAMRRRCAQLDQNGDWRGPRSLLCSPHWFAFDYGMQPGAKSNYNSRDIDENPTDSSICSAAGRFDMLEESKFH